MSDFETENKPANTVKKFNFNELRLGQDFSNIAVKLVLTRIGCRKPSRSEFFRTHSTFEFPTAILEDGDMREIYLVAQELWPEIGTDLKRKVFVLCTNRAGTPFLWPLSVPDADRSSSWTESAIAAATLGKESWVRIKADMAAQQYEVVVAESLKEQPQWPTLSDNEILELAFKNRIIDSLDHPILKKLRGEL